MKITNYVRCLALLMAFITLVGCGSAATTPETSEPPDTSESAIATTVIATQTPKPSPIVTPTPTIPIIPEEKPDSNSELTEQQRNSFAMLNYLTIISEEILISKDNKLLLEDIYTSLLNDINPGAIDKTTQGHLTSLRDTIKDYLNIATKRERLQFIYNQDKASAIRSAVPNPLAILSVTNAFNWRQLVTGVAYTIVDSYNNYKGAEDSANMEYLTSGWELDDEEDATIRRNREYAFDYMVDIVQEYHLDGLLTLNEEAVKNFAEICAIDSIQQKIRRLESAEDTYKLVGNYWLELVDCYYETELYEKCLVCVDKYNELSISIFRQDRNYVQILPKAIVAAQNTYSGTEYVSEIEVFADSIISNSKETDWSVRYFAAQVYIDLYAKTNNRIYLESAYKIVYDNVTVLIDEQRALNDTYIAEVKELTLEEPNYDYMTDSEKKETEKQYKAEKKQVKAYNKELKEARKTELPPLYEPLVLNCELLFALADEMNISTKEQSEIEAILRTDTNGVFLSKPINNHYSFSLVISNYSIGLSKKEILIPVYLLTAGADIKVSVTDSGKTVTFDDCTVKKVDRDGTDFDTFIAIVTSKQMKEYEWTADSKVTVKISSADGFDPMIFQFKVSEYNNPKIGWDKVEFEAA